MTTAARASGPRLRVLRALYDHPFEDQSGHAVHLLCQAARFDRQDALAQVLARMDNEGLIRRRVQGRRTYRIEITEGGRRLAGVPGHPKGVSQPARLRFDALPPGPASTWGGRNGGVSDGTEAGQPASAVATATAPPVPAGAEPAPSATPAPTDPDAPVPPALRDIAGLGGYHSGPAGDGIDYEILAGVLLQTALRAIRDREAPAPADGTGGPSGTSGAEAAALAEELSAARGRLFELEAQVRVLERNNRTLSDQLDRIGSRSRSGAAGPEMSRSGAAGPEMSRSGAAGPEMSRSGAGLTPGQRELAQLMTQRPTARG